MLTTQKFSAYLIKREHPVSGVLQYMGRNGWGDFDSALLFADGGYARSLAKTFHAELSTKAKEIEAGNRPKPIERLD